MPILWHPNIAWKNTKKQTLNILVEQHCKKTMVTDKCSVTSTLDLSTVHHYILLGHTFALHCIAIGPYDKSNGTQHIV